MSDIDALELALFEGLPSGVTVQGLLHDNLNNDWRDIGRTDTGTCAHENTLCAFCLYRWLKDWDIRLVEIRNGEEYEMTL